MTNQNELPIDRVTNIHEAMQEASTEGQDVQIDASVGQSFRLKSSEKALLDQICANHGTDASKFLRKCVQGLIRDYGHESEE